MTGFTQKNFSVVECVCGSGHSPPFVGVNPLVVAVATKVIKDIVQQHDNFFIVDACIVADPAAIPFSCNLSSNFKH